MQEPDDLDLRQKDIPVAYKELHSLINYLSMGIYLSIGLSGLFIWSMVASQFSILYLLNTIISAGNFVLFLLCRRELKKASLRVIKIFAILAGIDLLYTTLVHLIVIREGFPYLPVISLVISACFFSWMFALKRKGALE